MQFTYESGGQAHPVTLEPQPDGSYRADIAGRAYHVTAQQAADGGRLLVLRDASGHEARHLVYVEAEGESRYVHAGGGRYTLTIPEDRTRRRRGDAHAGDLAAQMPGQVTAVLVAAGDVVAAGDALVILEAMKMEIRITAPGPGIVARVPVRTGDVVERGQLLVEVHAVEGEGDA